MATNIPGNQARQNHRQTINTIRRQVNWNDSGIGAATGVAMGQLPQGAFITRVLVEVVTAFNGTTPLLSVGSNAGANNIVADGDIPEGTVGVYDVTRGIGRALTALQDTTIAVKLAVSGSPSTGQAEIVIQYEPNLG